jgi:tetratricopeptide (TPR) repeat protein
MGAAGVVRGADDPVIPYIITPRMTKIIDDTPTLRWNDSGADSYNVQVRGGDLSWQQTDVTQTKLVYPADPPLEPGVSYLLLVEDSNGKSSKDEGRVGLGFSLLSETKAAEIKEQREQIMALALSDTARNFALAQYYASQGLIAEGIEILEEMVEADSKEAAIHQSLADLYMQIGLFLLAEPRYGEALELAENEGNIERIADIHVGLGRVYLKLGNPDKAIERFTKAQANYETLGDANRVDEVTEWLAELKP